jgi:hypothetical protein
MKTVAYVTPTAPLRPAQVLDGLRAAYRYCRAMETLTGGLSHAERRALRWCLHADDLFRAAWEAATAAEVEEAHDLIAELVEYVAPAGQEGNKETRRRPAG